MSKTFRDDSPLTLVNGTQQMTWYPRRMDLPPLEGEHEANAGPCTGYKVSAPKVPRNRAPIFKTDKQMCEEGWEPVTSREAAALYATPIAILVVVLSVWAYWTWLA